MDTPELGWGRRIWALGLELKATEHSYRVLFTTAAAMMTVLTRSLAEARLEDEPKSHTVRRLLISDEIG